MHFTIVVAQTPSCFRRVARKAAPAFSMACWHLAADLAATASARPLVPGSPVGAGVGVRVTVASTVGVAVRSTLGVSEGSTLGVAVVPLPGVAVRSTLGVADLVVAGVVETVGVADFVAV